MPKANDFLGSQSSPPSIKSSKAGVFSARVSYAMLEGKTQPTAFKTFGEYQSIGGVFFTLLNNPNPNPDFSSDSFALPLFPNMSNIPLENEIVYIMSLPSTNVQSNVNSIHFYYFQPVNIWNSVHHNAIPDPINGDDNQVGDYQQIEGGTTRRVTDGGTEIDLGDTFTERIDTRNLQPYEGDIIYEGRWGQSFRFGSTVSGSIVPNPWSNSGINGDPIMILKNGQHEEDTPAWVPQVEDINTDASSIYLTSTQLIPINVASSNYLSYYSPPILTNEYDGEQIILNSGRLLLNSKSDSILLSSNNSINLNSINNVNIDSPSFIVKSNKIALGDKNATEPIILGNKFLSDFETLTKNISSLAKALQAPIGGPGDISAPVLGLVEPAIQLASSAGRMLSNIKNYKSTITTSK